MLGWIVIGAALVLGVPAAMYFIQDSLLFMPQPLLGPPPAFRTDRPLEDLTFAATDGTQLRGWLLMATTRPAPLVIYYGGNAEEVSWQVGAPWPSGWSLAFVNYRGYGTSEGKPSEVHLCEDAVRVFDALARRLDVDPSRIVLIGRSLGSGVATFVAAHRPLAGVILISPYDSMTELARRHYPWLPVRLLLRHPFDSHSLARTIHAPLVAIVAARDSIIPPGHSRRLFEAWGGAKRWVELPDVGHNDLSNHPAFWSAIETSLRNLRGNEP
jgi:pimeloyl-ACP methyl ester carboxylesterase